MTRGRALRGPVRIHRLQPSKNFNVDSAFAEKCAPIMGGIRAPRSSIIIWMLHAPPPGRRRMTQVQPLLLRMNFSNATSCALTMSMVGGSVSTRLASNFFAAKVTNTSGRISNAASTEVSDWRR